MCTVKALYKGEWDRGNAGELLAFKMSSLFLVGWHGFSSQLFWSFGLIRWLTFDLLFDQVADMAAAEGLVTLEDLARYHTSWEQPVSQTFFAKLMRLLIFFLKMTFCLPIRRWLLLFKVRADLPNTEFSLFSAPPPGSGAILAGILGLVRLPLTNTKQKQRQRKRHHHPAQEQSLLAFLD